MFLPTVLILIILSTCVNAKWNKWGQHEYKFFRGYVSQYDAEAKCNGYGGHLASIHSAAENDFVFGQLPGHVYAWIGLIRDENRWRWTDGTPANYLHWGRGQPDFWQKEEYCAWGFEGIPWASWNDVNCERKSKWLGGYICKRKAY